MSNLIKYNYIYFDGNDKKIIDSNSKKIEQFTMPSFDTGRIIPENESSGFVQGLNAIQIEKLVEDQNVQIEVNPEQILEEANEEANQIIERAKEEASQLYDNTYKEASQKGYEVGYNNAMREVEKLKSDLQRQMQRNQEEYEKQIMEIEPQVVDLMSGLIESITGILVEEKKEVILHLVNKAISNAESKKFLIRVSRYDYEFLNENKDKIYGALRSGIQMEIMEDHKLDANQCLIETDSGVINSSLDLQLKNLITDLKIMSHTGY